jgi:hypothetical protein
MENMSNDSSELVPLGRTLEQLLLGRILTVRLDPGGLSKMELELSHLLLLLLLLLFRVLRVEEDSSSKVFLEAALSTFMLTTLDLMASFFMKTESDEGMVRMVVYCLLVNFVRKRNVK